MGHELSDVSSKSSEKPAHLCPEKAQISLHNYAICWAFRCCAFKKNPKQQFLDFCLSHHNKKPEQPAKPHFISGKMGYTFLFWRKIINTHYNRFIEAVLMSGHNLCWTQKLEIQSGLVNPVAVILEKTRSGHKSMGTHRFQQKFNSLMRKIRVPEPEMKIREPKQ